MRALEISKDEKRRVESDRQISGAARAGAQGIFYRLPEARPVTEARALKFRFKIDARL
jgi:hypothetical protein